MNESSAAIFAKIAVEKGFLDEKKLDQARTLQKLCRREGQALPLDRACLELEILTPEQVRGLERGLKYYVARKADKIYAKLAVARAFCDADTVEHCLARQHTEFYKKHRLVRLAKLLLGLDGITPEHDAVICKAVSARLSPEESHQETAAVTEPEPPKDAVEETLPAGVKSDAEISDLLESGDQG